jgi:hypothetical protein
MRRLLALGFLWGVALAGSFGYGFLGYGGGLQGGGGSFGTLELGLPWALGGEGYGGPEGSGGFFLTGPLLRLGEGVYLLPTLGLGGGQRGGQGGFALDLGARGLYFFGEPGFFLGLGLGYTHALGFPGSGVYLRVLLGGGRP